MSDQQEMAELAPTDMKTLLDLCLSDNKNLMIWGPPGVGKTHLVRAAAKDYDGGYVALHLTLMEPVDIKGLPVVNEDRSAVKWVPMGELPTDPSSKGVIHLDELNTADPSVMAAAMQFCLDRRVGEYTLPPGWRIVACGNRVHDGASARKMPTALADRFSHVTLQTSVDDWTAWALDNGIEEALVGFINYRKEQLHNFSSSRTVNTTPRGWEDVNSILSKDPNMDGVATMAYISGRVGLGAATELRAFIKVWRHLPDIDKILSGEITELKDSQNPSVKYAVTMALALRVKKGTAGAMLAFLDKIGPEFSRLAVFAALKRKSGIEKDDDYKDWVVNKMQRLT